jgi:hypothetical protein
MVGFGGLSSYSFITRVEICEARVSMGFGYFPGIFNTPVAKRTKGDYT